MVKSSINRCPKKTMKREFCKGVGIMRKMGYNALLPPANPVHFFPSTNTKIKRESAGNSFHVQQIASLRLR